MRNLYIHCFITVLALTWAAVSAHNLPGIPLEFTADKEIVAALSADIARKYADEYLEYLRTGVESDKLREMSAQLASSHSQKDFMTMGSEDLPFNDQFFLCTTCQAVMTVFAEAYRDKLSNERVARRAFISLCNRLNIQTENVCGGLFDLNYEIISYLMYNSTANPRSICGMLPFDGCYIKQENYNWNIKIDTSKPLLTKSKSDMPKKTANDVNILQLTDIHYDKLYKPGSLAECGEALCCQASTFGNVTADKQAGYWSDYRTCDTPMYLIEDAFDHINTEHKKIDYIYQTGDIVPHLVWATTPESNMDYLTDINDLIEKKFPNLPVYSCIGNHEAHPCNVFGTGDIPDHLQITWLYEHLYKLWSRWLPASTKETILKGGYYTVSPKSGFRIISLNNNDCYLFNWWLYYDGSIAIEQLQWLHDTLLAAEKAGEYVHILKHLPSGDSDCWTIWAREYNRIIERFSHIISGIFTGHTHKDEMNVHYSNAGHAMAITWNGGSLTTYSDTNPNYRTYQAEPTKMEIVEQETWIFNLTEANQLGEKTRPRWFREYQFSTEFTNDLSPAGLDALLEKMATDPALLRKYAMYKLTSSDPAYAKGCDDNCLMRTICRLATSVWDQKDRCRALQDILKATLENDDDDGGAITIGAFKITSILGLVLAIKYML